MKKLKESWFKLIEIKPEYKNFSIKDEEECEKRYDTIFIEEIEKMNKFLNERY